MTTITASAPAITSGPRNAEPRLSAPTRWLITAAAAAAVALGGLTALLNAVEASEAAEYAASRPVAAGASSSSVAAALPGSASPTR